MKMKILLLLCKSSAYGLLHVSRDKRRGLPTALTTYLGGSCSEREQLKHADFVGCSPSPICSFTQSVWRTKKNSPSPLVVLVNKSKKIKKIVAQWVPSSVPFGDCEKRTVTRFALSFAFRLISLAQGLPFSTIYAFAFLFFSSPSD